jgi:hypothetical protein
MPALHELSDKELREKLSTGELSDRRPSLLGLFCEGVAKSVFRHGSSGTLGWERYSPPLD